MWSNIKTRFNISSSSEEPKAPRPVARSPGVASGGSGELFAKVVLLGGPGVGKSSIMHAVLKLNRREVDNTNFKPSPLSTVGIDVHAIRFSMEEGQLLTCMMWEVAYAEIRGYHLKFILSDCDAIVLVTDGSDAGLTALDEWRAVVAGMVPHSEVALLLVSNVKQTLPPLPSSIVENYCQLSRIPHSATLSLDSDDIVNNQSFTSFWQMLYQTQLQNRRERKRGRAGLSLSSPPSSSQEEQKNRPHPQTPLFSSQYLNLADLSLTQR